MEKTVCYLGYYDIEKNKPENRNYVLAATNKMTYIVSALEQSGFSVKLISASQTLNPQKYDGKVLDIGNNSKLILLKTLPWGNKLRRVCSRLYSQLQLLRCLKKQVKKGDTLLVYHSLAYARLLTFFKKRKGFRLVLEVEEIYADVTGREKDRKTEQQLFALADAYVFPTELLNEKLNAANKPHCIIYGTYQVEEDRHCSFNDGKIHAVYAGTFDPRKGVLDVVQAARFLDERYHVHIIGFGSKKDTENAVAAVKETAAECTCALTYDGCLSGEDYIRFLQSCQIGLSPQNADAKFNDTSFPSKVLSYLANGLRVVSIQIPSIARSAIGELISFYSESTPKAIAQAILNVDMAKPYDSRAKIETLHEGFVQKIQSLLEAVQ